VLASLRMLRNLEQQENNKMVLSLQSRESLPNSLAQSQMRKTESHLRELDFKNALFCMKGPFYDYDLAIRLLTDSVARWPDDWKLKALMCIASHKAGKKEDALRWFTQVNTQKGTLGDADIQSVPYLEKVLNELKRH